MQQEDSKISHVKQITPVKQNTPLVRASYILSLVEKRLIILAIAKANRDEVKISSSRLIKVSAKDYADLFNVSLESAYSSLRLATKNLYGRTIVFQKHMILGKIGVLHCRWISAVGYVEKTGYVALKFTEEVADYLCTIQEQYTSFEIKNIVNLQSFYSIRLYEYFKSWEKWSKNKIPTIALEELKSILGLEKNAYTRDGKFLTAEFNRTVLSKAVKEVNKNTDLQLEYSALKKGRNIIGYDFIVFPKEEKPVRRKMTEKQSKFFSVAISKFCSVNDRDPVVRKFSNKITGRCPKMMIWNSKEAHDFFYNELLSGMYFSDYVEILDLLGFVSNYQGI